MKRRYLLPMSTTLPPDAVAALVKASRYTDPAVRRVAVDRAIREIKYHHPEYFHKEQPLLKRFEF